MLRDFWRDFSTALDGTKDLRTTQVLDSLNDLLGPHIFPAKEDGSNPRACPSCENGQLSLKLGKFGAFIGCSNYPECKFTRTLSDRGEQAKGAEGDRPGVKVLGEDPKTGLEITLRDGRFGAYVQEGEGEKPKRSSLPKGLKAGRGDARKSHRSAVAAARSGETSGDRRADPRRHRALRLLCPAQEDLRQSRQGRRRAGDRRQSRHRSYRDQGSRRRLSAARAAKSARIGEHPEGGADFAQGRTVRALSRLGQGQRHSAARHGHDRPDAREGCRTAQGQGLRRPGRRARSRRPSRWRQDRRARGAVRALCLVGEGQRHPCRKT